MEVSAVVASVKAAIETLGKLREITTAMRNVELKATIATLANDLADAQIRLADLKQEVVALREENTALKSAETKKEPYTKQWGCCVFEGDKELYCPGCYAKNGKKSPTTRSTSRNRRCTVCGISIGS